MKPYFRHLLTLLLILIACQSGTAQKNFSVLGDSYSTFEGEVTPKWNDIWYSGNTLTNFGNDVTCVEQTWWHKLASTPEYVLDVNNSWSGSTICNTGYNSADYSDRSFITRVHNLGNPDVILIFGGTNDSWAGAPIGQYKYDDWTESDLYSFRPAFAFLLHQLKTLYPNATIINILNTELTPEINGSVDEICLHYGIDNLRLNNIAKQSGHPSAEGMQSIYEQVRNILSK